MEHQPNFYSLEQDGNSHRERKLNHVGDGIEDRHEALKIARLALIDNPKLQERFFEAVIQGEGNKDPSGFAAIENLFVKHCLTLDDAEIESLIRQFNAGLSEYAAKNVGILPSKVTSPESIKKQKRYASSIISVIDFINSRKKLLDIDPKTQHEFFTEDILDAKYQIDLIECIYEEIDGEMVVHTMNLVQVKSSDPTESDIRNITDGHRAWINSSVMDFDAFRREYTDGMPDEVTLELLGNDATEIIGLLLEVWSNPGDFNPEDFIKKLELDDLNNKQKAWLLRQFTPIVIEHLRKGAIEHKSLEKDVELTIKKLTDLEEKVCAKAKLPRNLARVQTINSIITVGAKIVHQTILQEKPENQDKAKILKYN